MRCKTNYYSKKFYFCALFFHISSVWFLCPVACSIISSFSFQPPAFSCVTNHACLTTQKPAPTTIWKMKKWAVVAEFVEALYRFKHSRIMTHHLIYCTSTITNYILFIDTIEEEAWIESGQWATYDRQVSSYEGTPFSF